MAMAMLAWHAGLGGLATLAVSRAGYAAGNIGKHWVSDVAALGLAGCLAGILVHLRFEDEADRVMALILAAALATLARVDCRAFRLPDQLTLPLAALGLLAASLKNPETFPSAAAGCLVFAVTWRLVDVLAPSSALPGGDFKLLAAAAAWTGPAGAAAALAVACAIAWLVGSRRDPHRCRRIPFGAYLAPTIWAVHLSIPPDLPSSVPLRLFG
ncbi:MAG: prepilin peptidase [Rhizorhabdus sp.]|nr:prepilin peptidase [Rhizorhabdus sp.]